MTLNDIKFKPWRNGKKSNVTGYGLSVSKEYTQLFPQKRKKFSITVSNENEKEDIEFNLNSTFWTTYPVLKNNRIKKWTILSKTINRQGKKTVYKTTYIKDNHFAITN